MRLNFVQHHATFNDKIFPIYRYVYIDNYIFKVHTVIITIEHKFSMHLVDIEVGLSDSIDSAIYRDSKLLSTSGYFTK